MWEFLGTQMEAPMIDEGVFKKTSEFLVHGFAYPDASGSNAVAAQAKFAGRRKTILASGDRYWNGSTTSPPRPFERMPIHWSKAYGGEDYPINLLGKGRQTVEGLRELPNLELPHSRLMRPDDQIVPASLGPLDPMHPQRAAFRGTYDQNWLKDHSPGLPPDANWNYFNLAPRDQWLDAPLKGDEAFEFQNMHPDKAIVSGVLPGLRVRIFTKQQSERGNTDNLKFREVASGLTTVWFFPHAECAVLIYQGMARTLEDDAHDVRQVMGAIERIGEPPKTDAYYLEQFEKRTTDRHAGIQLLNDTPLLPDGISTWDPEADAKQQNMKVEGFKEHAQARRAEVDINIARERARAQGQDPDALGIVVPKREKQPSLEELPAYLDKMAEQQEKANWATVEQMVDALEKVVAAAKRGEVDPKELVSRGPPKFSGRAELARLEQVHREQDKEFDSAATAQKLALMELSGRENYRKSAHMQPPAHRLKGALADERRSEIEWLAANGQKSIPGIDLTGVDLSNMDLRGMDFSGAWLESSNLAGSNLTRAKFNSAVLAHADFTDAIAVGADFSQANLGNALFKRTVLARSKFCRAIFMRSHLIGTDMRWADLRWADVLETVWEGVDCSEAMAGELFFHKLKLDQNLFSGARLEGSTFLECSLIEADFTECNLSRVNFLGCIAQKARFDAALMKQSVFATDCDFSGASFAGADLSAANIGESDLSGSRLRSANLDGANLTRANLKGSDLSRATFRGALLRKAKLTKATATEVDFKNAMLQGAILHGTDIRQSHFFGADLSRVELDTKTQTDDAVFERARVHPRFQAPQV